MVLQLGAVRSTLAVDTPQAEMMQGVERLGRQSVLELRSLVGILRETSAGATAPQPTLALTQDLVAEVRAAGLPVSLDIDGDLDSLPRALDVSAYRVVQEALTNVLRHNGPTPTRVAVRRAPDAVTIEVVNDRPAAPPSHVDDGGGHGIVGMRERVAMFDGTLLAAARADGGFVVRAVFPTGGTS
jgi:signal transduction histidine kinase